MLTCHADWTLTWHADWAYWRHGDVMMTSSYPGLARGSGRLVFGSGRVIRVRRTRVTRGARLCAWLATLTARDGACGLCRRPISTRFSTVASSLAPLHSGMVKTQF